MQLICCLGTTILARLQTVYVILNVVLCMVVIIALPAATPAEFKNTASFALGDFKNCMFSLSSSFVDALTQMIQVNGWPNGYAFILVSRASTLFYMPLTPDYVELFGTAVDDL